MLLLAPGPVYVPKEILDAQREEMITHRSEEFSELYENIVSRFRRYIDAEESIIMTGSGTIGIEAVVLNLVEKKDRVLCLTNGVFGDKLGKIAKIYGECEIHSLEAGRGWGIERAKEKIDESNADALCMVYNETGYGVRNRLKDISLYAKKKGMKIIVDGVSAWPGTPFNMKEFKVDGFITGSQKGPGCPPGLALVGLSREAIEAIERRDNIPSWYCDFRAYRKRYEKSRQTPFTPAISLMRALRKSFDMIDEGGGIENAVRRHGELSEYVRKRVNEMGFRIIAEKGFESHTLTAFEAGENAGEIKKILKEKYGIVIVGCKGVYSKTGLRISNMGWVTKEMLDRCLNAIEEIKDK